MSAISLPPVAQRSVKSWSQGEVIQWLMTIGFQDCVPVFQAHQISGLALPKLTPNLLAEMGVASVGRRILLMNEITKVQAEERNHWRIQVVWEGEEYRAGPCNGVLPYNFPLCAGDCQGKPAHYRLTNSKFTVTRWKPNYDGKFCYLEIGICGHTMKTNTVDLNNVKDVDSAGSTTLVGDPPGKVILQTTTGPEDIVLKSSECQKVTAILTNTKEENLIQEGLAQFGRA